MKLLSKYKHIFYFLLLSCAYFFVRLYGLEKLPIFADEAIYIRWAQLIMDEPMRYLFFPLNDGKTPLFIWMLVPAQYLFESQLFAARIVSVGIGFLQMIAVMKLIKVLGGSRALEYLGASFVVLLPFWYFHHRMALMDGLLTLFISLSVLFLTWFFKSGGYTKIYSWNTKSIVLLLLAGVSFGLALLSKIPAVLATPAFVLLIFLDSKQTLRHLFIKKIVVAAAILLGVAVFALLYFAPAFGQLFGRGGDFLYSPSTLLLEGGFIRMLSRVPSIFGYFFQYSSIFLYIVILVGLFSKKNQKLVHIFFWGGILFIAPIALLGQVVYPRYVFPAIFFFTIAAVFSFDAIISTHIADAKSMLKRTLVALLVALSLANIYTPSIAFIAASATDSDKTPFVQLDTVQYLTEWSSGHGIHEAYMLIAEESAQHSIAVGTEGYFGTLPDGLLTYFHRRPVENIYIEGIGYPVGNIPQSFLTRAKEFEKQWVVVNSHRMNLELPASLLVAEYCRPMGAPCLQVWDITSVIDTLPVSE